MKNIWGKELKFPEDLYYSDDLIWVKSQEGNKVRIGVSHLGVKSVKTLNYVKIAVKVGGTVTKGEPLGHVETTKGVWEVIAPINGTVVEVNQSVAKGNASPIIDDAYGNGWLVDVEMADESELQALRKGSDADTKQWIQEKAEELVPLMLEDEDDD